MAQCFKCIWYNVIMKALKCITLGVIYCHVLLYVVCSMRSRIPNIQYTGSYLKNRKLIRDHILSLINGGTTSGKFL